MQVVGFLPDESWHIRGQAVGCGLTSRLTGLQHKGRGWSE